MKKSILLFFAIIFNHVTIMAQSSNALLTAACANVNLDILFDGFPNQSSWDITDANGTVVASGGTYGSQPGYSSLSLIAACLVDGCYDLNFHDTLNNGTCPFSAVTYAVSIFLTPGTSITPGSIVGTSSIVAAPGLCGSYELTDALGNTLVSGGGAFPGTQSTNFCLSGGVAPRLTNQSIDETKGLSDSSLSVFPNIASHQIEISYQSDVTVKINLLGPDGKIIQQFSPQTYNEKYLKIDISNSPVGLNFVQLITENKVIIKKFIKQ